MTNHFPLKFHIKNNKTWRHIKQTRFEKKNFNRSIMGRTSAIFSALSENSFSISLGILFRLSANVNACFFARLKREESIFARRRNNSRPGTVMFAQTEFVDYVWNTRKFPPKLRQNRSLRLSGNWNREF